MHKIKKIYDISIDLKKDTVVYPGDPIFSKLRLYSLDNKDNYNLTQISMTCHTGTHIDVSSHMINNKKFIDKYNAEKFILKTHVVDIKTNDFIKIEDVKKIDIKKGDAVLFKTNNSKRNLYQKDFIKNYVYLSVEAAYHCIIKKIGLIGIDYLSVDNYEDNDYKAHKLFFNADIPILESINLNDVPAGIYTLVCLPLKLSGCEASPVRAVLMK